MSTTIASSGKGMSPAERMSHIRGYASQLSAALPEVMKSFYGLSKASTAAGELDTKTKELIALAIAVATHCDDCILFHTHSALKAGATYAEIMDMLGVAVFMGGGPSLMYASHVLEVMEAASAS